VIILATNIENIESKGIKNANRKLLGERRRNNDKNINGDFTDIAAVDGKTTIKLTTAFKNNKTKLKNNSPILIAGFPGPGFVGSIATSYIIDKLNMQQIACVESQFISPGVIYIGGRLRHPFRLYANVHHNVCVLVCEAPVLIHGIYSLLDTVIRWSIKNRVKEVLVLEGIPVQGLPNSDREPIMLSGNEEDENVTSTRVIDNNNENIGSNMIQFQDQKADTSNKITNGKTNEHTAFIGGISGGLLSSCLSNGIQCTAVLIPAPSGIPDPEGAAIMIEAISKITDNEDLKIDVKKLRDEGASLKLRMQEIIRSVQDQQQQADHQVNQEQQQQQKSIYG
jgi:uncharacterized protein